MYILKNISKPVPKSQIKLPCGFFLLLANAVKGHGPLTSIFIQGAAFLDFVLFLQVT